MVPCFLPPIFYFHYEGFIRPVVSRKSLRDSMYVNYDLLLKYSSPNAANEVGYHLGELLAVATCVSSDMLLQ